VGTPCTEGLGVTDLISINILLVYMLFLDDVSLYKGFSAYFLRLAKSCSNLDLMWMPMWSHCDRKRKVLEKVAEDMYIQKVKMQKIASVETLWSPCNVTEKDGKERTKSIYTAIHHGCHAARTLRGIHRHIRHWHACQRKRCR
jgi:hypothetical protein